jgi:quercetin dioxygenase-like cupin family protein
MPHQGPGYVVKSVEPVAIGSDVQARVFTLAPGEEIPWHFHSAVTDWYFVLEGTLSIETRGPHDRRLLRVGERYNIPAKTAHLIGNRGDGDTRFVLVQGVGAYDFMPVGGDSRAGSGRGRA